MSSLGDSTCPLNSITPHPNPLTSKGKGNSIVLSPVVERYKAFACLAELL